MAEKKKYYWLKLKRDFFKRHDIRIVESMPNGKDYILFYLKLLLESIDHEGTLRFSETIPYNEEMLSVVTDTNIDTVRSAMKLFLELNMMTVFDDQTIYMNEVNNLIGSAVDNDNANRVRRCREKQKSLALQNVTVNVTKCNESKSKDKEKHKDIDKEVVAEADETASTTATATEDTLKVVVGTLGKGVVYLTDRQLGDLMDRLGLDAFNRYVDRLATWIIDNNAYVKSHYDTILKWYEEDSKVSNKKTNKNKTRYGDFDPNEAFEAALNRPFPGMENI
jgi:predicted phage replisome organizer